MFTISTRKSHGFCDGVSRRDMLRVGAMGLGGLTLAELFRAEAQAGIGSSTKAIINVHLGGGPSHQDMFDLKPEAPVEFRGEFNPIKTNVSGIEICEHMPRLAKMADKYAVVRSLVGMKDDHTNYQTHTGYDRNDLRNVGGRPAIGSVVTKLLGPSGSGAPAWVSYNGGDPGFLGPVFSGYKPSGGSDLKLLGSMTSDRLQNRTELLASLDKMKRQSDSSGSMAALDAFTQRAVGVVTSGAVADALDLQREDAKTRERYGEEGKMFLTARRLVEAGVRMVTFDWGGWDTHSDNFNALRRQLPRMDQAVAALVNDLYDRGMSQDVTLILWGEFGRTPRVNPGAGRDHWSKLSMCFLSGGGMRMGQAIGTSTRYAEEAKDRPVHLREVLATLYHNIGINVAETKVMDPAGRPQYLAESYRPIQELV